MTDIALHGNVSHAMLLRSDYMTDTAMHDGHVPSMACGQNLYRVAASALGCSACSWCSACVPSFGDGCLCNVLKPPADDFPYTKAAFGVRFSDLDFGLCCLQELDWLKGHEAKEAAAKGIAGHKLPMESSSC